MQGLENLVCAIGRDHRDKLALIRDMQGIQPDNFGRAADLLPEWDPLFEQANAETGVSCER
jgi:hypothetical protein